MAAVERAIEQRARGQEIAGWQIPRRRCGSRSAIHAWYIAAGSNATVSATCATISSVHSRPICIREPLPGDSPCSPACTWRPVALSAGTTPTIAAASSVSADDIDQAVGRKLQATSRTAAGRPIDSDRRRSSCRSDTDSRPMPSAAATPASISASTNNCADDAAAAGAERAAHGDFALAGRGARIDEDRHVDAHHDQQQHDRELDRAAAPARSPDRPCRCRHRRRA